MRSSGKTPFALTPALGLMGLLMTTLPSMAGPTVGFQEDFPGTSTQGWAGGGASGLTISNPGTGGADGGGDGYLLLTLASDGFFGARSTGPEYQGDWVAAGVQIVRVSLNDVGADDAFEIHFCIGNQGNFWQYNVGFSPPNGSWQEFYIDLNAVGSFTRIIGSGTFTQAKQFADRILLRHDLPPFSQGPDMVHGDLGIDHVLLTDIAVPASRSTWGRLMALYR